MVFGWFMLVKVGLLVLLNVNRIYLYWLCVMNGVILFGSWLW